GEVLQALLIDMIASLGAMGGFALWWYASGGEPALARAMGETSSDSVQMDQALHSSNIVMFVFIAGTIGPIVEELAFRGLLYPAWRNAWGWIAATVASALVFGLFHGAVWRQFIAGIVYVVAMRRTG